MMCHFVLMHRSISITICSHLTRPKQLSWRGRWPEQRLIVYTHECRWKRYWIGPRIFEGKNWTKWELREEYWAGLNRFFLDNLFLFIFDFDWDWLNFFLFVIVFIEFKGISHTFQRCFRNTSRCFWKKKKKTFRSFLKRRKLITRYRSHSLDEKFGPYRMRSPNVQNHGGLYCESLAHDKYHDRQFHLGK